jgi:hypothetical protein
MVRFSLFSTGTSRINRNGRISFLGTFPTTAIRLLHCLCLDIPSRREPYNEILQHEIYHKVSPAYAKRFQKADESEEQYVERLRQELEDKILELGPETVIGCRSPHLLAAGKRRSFLNSRCRNRGRSNNWGCSCATGLLQGY